MRWIDDLMDGISKGRHAFILTGAIGDGFPRPEGKKADSLGPWYEAAEHAIEKARPTSMRLAYDIATGFDFALKDDDERFLKLIEPKKAEPEEQPTGGKKKDEDPMAAVRAELDKQRNVLADDIGGAMHQLMRAFGAASAQEEPYPIVALLHDVEAAWSANMSDPRLLAPFLLIERFAQNDWFRAQGHVMVLATKSLTLLPERFRSPDSPFLVIEVTRPDQEERVKYLTTVTLSEKDSAELQADIARQQAAHGTDETRLRGELTRLTAEAEAQERGASAAVATDPAVVAALAALAQHAQYQEPSYRQLRERIEGFVGASEVYETELRASGALRDLTPADWPTVAAGDIVLSGRPRGTLLHAECHRVLETRTEMVQLQSRHLASLSSRSDLAQRTMSRTRDDKVVYTTWADDIPISHCVDLGEAEGGWQIRPVDNLVGDYYLIREADAEEYLRRRTEWRLLPELRIRLEAFERKFGLAELAEEVAEATKAATAAHANAVSESHARVAAAREAHALHVARPNAPQDRARKQLAENGKYLAPTCGRDVAARLTQGMGYRDIVSLLRAAWSEGRALSKEDILGLRLDILRRSYGHLIEIIEPSYGFEGIAGLTKVKRFLRNARDHILAGRYSRAPMGCLLAGPPGTGKTAAAEGFAMECGFLYGKVRNMRSMWVGESERQMEELGRAVRALTPLVIVRDEVDREDQSHQGVQGDSGVSARMQQQWMQLLSDEKLRGRLLVISCTNRPERIDPALKRAGRTDARFPVLTGPEERAEIFPVMFRRFASKTTEQITWDVPAEGIARLIDLTHDYTGAQIQLLVANAAEYAADESAEPDTFTVRTEHFERAIADYIPSESAEENARMKLQAIGVCSRREYLPDNVTDIVAECRAILGLDAEEATGEVVPAASAEDQAAAIQRARDAKAKREAARDEVMRRVLEANKDKLPKA